MKRGTALVGERGTGFIQIILVLLVIGVVTMIALKMYQRAPLPEVGPGGGDPRRAVMDRVTIQLEGVKSDIDAAQVEEAVRKVPGVASITVAMGNEEADVAYNPSRTNPDAVVAAIRRAGYRASY